MRQPKQKMNPGKAGLVTKTLTSFTCIENKNRLRELEHAVLALATRGKQGNKLLAKMKDFHSIRRMSDMMKVLRQ